MPKIAYVLFTILPPVGEISHRGIVVRLTATRQVRRLRPSRRMLHPNFDPAPTTVRIHRYGYVSRCKARGCLKRATLIAEKVDCAGRHLRQIELCAVHQIVIERERARGLKISDRRESG